MDARFELVRRLNLRGVVAGSMIIDYHKVADSVSVEDYVRDVVAGVRWDTNLSKQLRKGFQVQNLIPNYVHDDLCLDWGVNIIWHNPHYRSGEQPAATLTQRKELIKNDQQHHARSSVTSMVSHDHHAAGPG